MAHRGQDLWSKRACHISSWQQNLGELSHVTGFETMKDARLSPLGSVVPQFQRAAEARQSARMSESLKRGPGGSLGSCGKETKL